MSAEVRTFRSPMPRRMEKLPVDERGYPVPWFVDCGEDGKGKPEFRAMDGRKLQRAIREKLCWVCGEPLGVNLCFVAGPICGVNRISSEPPSHRDCARWSAENCPFLSNPAMVRREDEEINTFKCQQGGAAGCPLARNPGVAMLWITRSYEVVPAQPGKILIVMGEPSSVEWWREGRPATRAEVVEAVESGLPILEATAVQHGAAALKALQRGHARLRPWMPEV